MCVHIFIYTYIYNTRKKGRGLTPPCGTVSRNSWASRTRRRPPPAPGPARPPHRCRITCPAHGVVSRWAWGGGDGRARGGGGDGGRLGLVGARGGHRQDGRGSMASLEQGAQASPAAYREIARGDTAGRCRGEVPEGGATSRGRGSGRSGGAGPMERRVGGRGRAGPGPRQTGLDRGRAEGGRAGPQPGRGAWSGSGPASSNWARAAPPPPSFPRPACRLHHPAGRDHGRGVATGRWRPPPPRRESPRGDATGR